MMMMMVMVTVIVTVMNDGDASEDGGDSDNYPPLPFISQSMKSIWTIMAVMVTIAQGGCVGSLPVGIGVFERSSDDHQKCLHGTVEEGIMIMMIWSCHHGPWQS